MFEMPKVEMIGKADKYKVLFEGKETKYLVIKERDSYKLFGKERNGEMKFICEHPQKSKIENFVFVNCFYKLECVFL